MPGHSIFLLDELIGVASGGRPVSLQKLHVSQPSNFKAPTKAPAATVKQSAPPGGAPVAAGGGGGALPATKLLYQADTYLFTAEATVLEVGEKAGGGGWAVVLDETCFHAQGGGQPADTGTLTRAGGGAAWAVRMVKKDGEGVVRHDGEPGGPAPDFGAGDTVSLAVDEPPRRRRAYVEYEGKLEASEREALLPKLQAADRPSTHRRFPEGAVKVEAVKGKGKVTRISYTVLDG
ncbi:hypothetical protein EMIHUDRAFT_99415 [Emiliania huxleyi CCMP1516]|uniref:Alanyl-tRNA synthetase class IIc N-terminal domain-containing protein n=2 Tax=Emiliania huxleyi TaxID=2903 RepID=A0A0D3K2H1_EMIH1|nr:hypothetical protein EMIHUDRAFT_99415 [Emiliania huxleyi CCMP1516]EOD29956.1 hypothetical protein EMIHUDRAFT_99415 [Emiliania huxleyi CCMP1516]|eukprot:XP_005782385.1 hypothetical protein EMIHUDRAFT_99415 [Emiliania huxleyi CCMP1516]